jgi:hypothetical protein
MLAVPSVRALSLFVAFSVITACGDDDAAKPSDAGTRSDAAVKDAGSNMIPRKDAQVSGPDPIPACDRSDPAGCPSGQVCDLIIRRAAGEMQFQFYAGCVDQARERALGDPCDPQLPNGTPYTTPGLVDEVYRDPCGVGLICAPSSNVRGGSSCQAACGGTQAETQIDCKSDTAVCFNASQIAQFCYEAELCDVTKQTGCPNGQACYLVPSTDNKKLISLCSAVPMAPIADGEACDFLSCKPGRACFGSVHVPISQWQQSDLKCRPVCSLRGGSDDSDAGAQDDGGVGGGCSAKKQCEPFTASGLSLSLIPNPPYGQCEP